MPAFDNWVHKEFPHALECGLYLFQNECTCHIRRLVDMEIRIEELEAQLEACRGEIGHLQAQLSEEGE